MKVEFKNSDFFGVPFPVAVADRYIKAYETEIGVTLDVIRWDAEKNDGVYEVLKGRTNSSEMSNNPTGNVSFDMQNGAFIYKFSPKPGISSINGRAPVAEEWTVRIDDREATVLKGSQEVKSLKRGDPASGMVAIQVGADGSVSTGVTDLPQGLEVERFQ